MFSHHSHLHNRRPSPLYTSFHSLTFLTFRIRPSPLYTSFHSLTILTFRIRDHLHYIPRSTILTFRIRPSPLYTSFHSLTILTFRIRDHLHYIPRSILSPFSPSESETISIIYLVPFSHHSHLQNQRPSPLYTSFHSLTFRIRDHLHYIPRSILSPSESDHLHYIPRSILSPFSPSESETISIIYLVPFSHLQNQRPSPLYTSFHSLTFLTFRIRPSPLYTSFHSLTILTFRIRDHLHYIPRSILSPFSPSESETISIIYLVPFSHHSHHHNQRPSPLIIYLVPPFSPSESETISIIYLVPFSHHSHLQNQRPSPLYTSFRHCLFHVWSDVISHFNFFPGVTELSFFRNVQFSL